MVYCVWRGIEGVVDAEGVADAERVDDAEGWEANRSCWLEWDLKNSLKPHVCMNNDIHNADRSWFEKSQQSMQRFTTVIMCLSSLFQHNCCQKCMYLWSLRE